MVTTQSLDPGIQVIYASWFSLVYVSIYGGGHKGLRGSGRRVIIKAKCVARSLQLNIWSQLLCNGSWSSGGEAFLCFRTFSQHPRRSEGQAGWTSLGSREKHPAEALGLITMMSEYLQGFNIDFTAKFSTVVAATTPCHYSLFNPTLSMLEECMQPHQVIMLPSKCWPAQTRVSSSGPRIHIVHPSQEETPSKPGRHSDQPRSNSSLSGKTQGV